MNASAEICKERRLYEKLQIVKGLQRAQCSSTYINLISTILQDCIDTRNVSIGRQVHCLISQQGLEGNTFLGSYFIRLFSLCGKLLEASLIFAKLLSPNVFAWSEILLALSDHGEDEQAVLLHDRMMQTTAEPDGHVYVAFLRACANIGDMYRCRHGHHQVVESAYESDLFVVNTIINMYAKCGALDDASEVFERISHRDVVSWSVMIAAYAQHALTDEAYLLFEEMQKEGIEPNNVAWNAMIYGYLQNEDNEAALGFFYRMLESKKQPDNFTYVSVLKACSSITAVDQGRLIHADITEAGFSSDIYIRSILIDLYAKSGDLDDVRHVFEENRNRNAVIWTAMMATHALRSEYEMVLHYFEGMQREGFSPNNVTFLCLLSACSHMGLVSDGFQHFDAMIHAYGIPPTSEHYNCLIDLLGRAGLFSEVNHVLDSMSCSPNIVGWTSLLNSSRMYGNSDLGRKCLQHVANIELRDASGYVLLSKLFNSTAMWDDMTELLEQRKSLNAWKKPGNACIEIEKKVHTFTMGDTTHSQVHAIYAKLQRLSVSARKEGYLPELELVMPLL